MTSADNNIKKITVLQSSLPSTSNYTVRYRFVSEDKNRTSHWSPTYEIDTSANPGY